MKNLYQKKPKDQKVRFARKEIIALGMVCNLRVCPGERHVRSGCLASEGRPGAIVKGLWT